MTSLPELKEIFTTIANYGYLIFSFSFFILTLSVIIWAFMLTGISVILSYIMLIVSYIYVNRLTKGKNLSPRQRRAYGQTFLVIFMFSSIGLSLMFSSFGLTYINPALLFTLLLIILINFLLFFGILDAINRIHNGSSHKNPSQYSQQLLYTQQQTFKSFNRPFPLPDVVRNFRLGFMITNDGVSGRNIIGLIFVYILLIFIIVYLDYLAFKSLLA